MNKILAIFTVIFLSACTAASLEPIPEAAPSKTPAAIIETSTPKNESLSTRSQMSIPMGTAPTIDGQLSPGEWDAAATTELSDASQIYFMYSDNALYVAVDANVLGIVNVGILKDGELWILHSSAALGSAVFQAQEDKWQMTKTFEWCCRSTANSFEYENLLEKEGWLSTNQHQGNEYQTEYMILIPPDEITISVTYLFMDGSGAAFWPETLEENDLLRFDSQPSVGDIAIFSSDLWVNLLVSE